MLSKTLLVFGLVGVLASGFGNTVEGRIAVNDPGAPTPVCAHGQHWDGDHCVGKAKHYKGGPSSSTSGTITRWLPPQWR